MKQSLCAAALVLASVLHSYEGAGQTPNPSDCEHRTYAPVLKGPERVRLAGPFRQAIIVFVSPTQEQFNEWKASFEKEEDFFVMADDDNWYRSEAFDFLACQTFAKVIFIERGPLEFVVQGEVWRYEFEDRPFLDAVVAYRPGDGPEELGSFLDLIVAYRPGAKPLLVAPIDVRRLADYFSGEHP